MVGLGARAPRSERPRAFTGTERFEVIGQLGAGGMGVVHEVYDRVRNVRVALKTLREMGPRELLLFKDEFRAARDFSHPNVVRLGELVEDEGRWLFTMELVRGQSLLRYVGQREVSGGPPVSASPTTITEDDSLETQTIPPAELDAAAASGRRDQAAWGPLAPPPETPRPPSFDEARLRAVLAQLAQALHALHDRGIVHRDIKPSNVLVTAEGRAVLLDFGVALADNATGVRGIVGSPAFMAPEQFQRGDVGPEADWYAFGTILFCALTGDLPFRGAAPLIADAKARLDAPDPGRYVRDLPVDLRALCRELMARYPAQRPKPEEILRRLGARAERDPHDLRLRVPFVGREQELRVVERAFAGACAGEPRAVFLEGESGIGKSACVDEFLSRIAHHRKALVLRSRCHEREAVPYKAFDRIVDALARVLSDHPSWLPEERDGLGALARIFPVLESVPGLSELRGQSKVGGDVRELAFPALRRLLASVARRRQLVMVIDDAQWADPDSLVLLEAVFASDLRAPLFLLATARSGADGQACAAFEAVQIRAERVRLARLSEADTRTLVNEVVRQLPSEVASAAADVADAAAGHPMFVGELILHLTENPQASARAVDLDDAIRGRVARLDEASRRVVELAAVAGVPMPHAVVRGVVGLDAGDYTSAVDRLVCQQLLRVTGHGDQDTVQPYHDRVREAVHAGLDSSRRLSVQAALGTALERGGAEPGLIAAFYDAAGDAARARPFAEDAAAHARQVLAFDRAADFYQMTLKAVPEGAPERKALLTDLGVTLKYAGHRERSAQAFEAAAALADPQAKLDLQRLAGDQLLSGGYVVRGWRVLQSVLRAFRLKKPRSILWSGLRSVLELLALMLRPIRWSRRRREEVAGSREAICVDLTWNVSSGLCMIDTVHAIYFALLHARQALALGDSERVARAMCAASLVATVFDLKGQAARLSRGAAVAAEEDGGPLARFYAEGCLFLQAFLLEHDWRRTQELHRRIESLWRQAGMGRSFEMDIMDQFASWSLWNQGDFVRLRNQVQKLVTSARRAGNPFLSTSLRGYHSILFLADDDPEGAEEDLEAALKEWDAGEGSFQMPQAWALFSRAEILLYRGAAARRVCLEPLFRCLSRSLLHQINWVRVRRDHTRVRLYLAEAAASEGAARRRALRGARRWLARLRRQGSPSALAFASLSEAALAHLRGDDEGARAALRAAVRLTEERDLGAFLDAARLRLAQLSDGPGAEAALRDAWDALRARGVKNPARMADVLAPGWPAPAAPAG